jgi:hypothetical protein
MATKCANAANLGIIGHLKQLEHQQSQRGNSNLKFTIRKAMKSIKLFPLPINSIEDAKLLEGVGDFLASKIARYIEAHGGGCHNGAPTGSDNLATEQGPSSSSSTSSSSETYVPAFGKGPWYALVSTWLSGGDSLEAAVPKATIVHKMNEAFATMQLPAVGGSLSFATFLVNVINHSCATYVNSGTE